MIRHYEKASMEVRNLYIEEDTELMGLLFEYMFQIANNIDMDIFVEDFMKSTLRKALDWCDAQLLNLHPKRLLEIYIKHDLVGNDIFSKLDEPSQFRENELIWIGEAYVRLSIYKDWSSKETIENIPFKVMRSAYLAGHEMGWSSFLARFDRDK